MELTPDPLRVLMRKLDDYATEVEEKSYEYVRLLPSEVREIIAALAAQQRAETPPEPTEEHRTSEMEIEVKNVPCNQKTDESLVQNLVNAICTQEQAPSDENHREYLKARIQLVERLNLRHDPDLVLIRRDLLGAAVAAIRHGKPAPKTVEAIRDVYLATPPERAETPQASPVPSGPTIHRYIDGADQAQTGWDAQVKGAPQPRSLEELSRDIDARIANLGNPDDSDIDPALLARVQAALAAKGASQASPALTCGNCRNSGVDYDTGERCHCNPLKTEVAPTDGEAP